mgnify:CR=1 FL=1
MSAMNQIRKAFNAHSNKGKNAWSEIHDGMACYADPSTWNNRVETLRSLGYSLKETDPVSGKEYWSNGDTQIRMWLFAAGTSMEISISFDDWWKLRK